MSAAHHELILKNLSVWGAMLVDEFRTTYGTKIYDELIYLNYIEIVESDFGLCAYIAKKGRYLIKYRSDYVPSNVANSNSIAHRYAIRTLLREGYSKPIPRYYGKAHTQMVDPQGKFVCVVARAYSYHGRSLKVLLGNLFGLGQFPELDRLIIFHPKIRTVKLFEENYKDKIEVRKLSRQEIIFSLNDFFGTELNKISEKKVLSLDDKTNIVLAIIRGKSVKYLADYYKVSEETLYVWYNNFIRSGQKSLLYEDLF